jgi:hypothetical protein
MKKIDIALLPHLGTDVGIHGSLKQQEVGGGACVAAVVALVSGDPGGGGLGASPHDLESMPS